ncbi:hypothetical protein GTR04_0346 [Trichophyton interdigitale]|nr:hypothetical protein GY631_0236 [Trichophyton interdigitale]KAG8212243.1 hypothetical protein GTR04_0346 [Trichophyton interdigitale]
MQLSPSFLPFPFFVFLLLLCPLKGLSLRAASHLPHGALSGEGHEVPKRKCHEGRAFPFHGWRRRRQQQQQQQRQRQRQQQQRQQRQRQDDNPDEYKEEEMASTDAAAANPTMSMAEAIVTMYGQFNTWPFYLLVLVVSLSFSRLAEIPVSWLRRRPSSRPAGNEAGLRAAQPQAPHVYHCCIEALQPLPMPIAPPTQALSRARTV